MRGGWPGILQRVSLFSPEDRDRLRQRVLQMADDDARVVAGAEVGSLAAGPGDRWSDLDLTFAVADGFTVAEVLEDWTNVLSAEVGAVQLFDLLVGATVYRVFLIPGCLQFDLSLSPAAQFGAMGPRFRLLFGEAVEKAFPTPPDAGQIFGLAVHHALRARFCVERGRLWQAEHWLSGLRDEALNLACLRRGLPARNGRGYDELPADVLSSFEGALATSLAPEELLRALAVAIDGLLREAGEARELAARVAPELRKLALG